MFRGKKPKLNGKPVYRGKGSIQAFIHQQVGVIIQQLNGAFPVELIGAHSQVGRQLMQGKKLHDPPYAHLQPEFFPNGHGLQGADAANFRQALRLLLHNGQGLGAETVHDPQCHADEIGRLGVIKSAGMDHFLQLLLIRSRHRFRSGIFFK